MHRFRLSAAIGLMVALCAPALAIGNPEIEPNDSKLQATLADSAGAGMSTADFITGTTTGSGSGGGLTSADYFIVETAPNSYGFYRHQLVITSDTPGHALSIRGRSQLNGIINTSSDVAFQNSFLNYPGTPAGSRTIVWFGFGKRERIFIRVTGTANTTAPYRVELTTTPITPVSFSSTISEGSITLERDFGNAANTDFWVYNAALFPIPGYGNDEPRTLTRPYSPGFYYVAYSNANTANDQPSPPDDLNRNGNVLDFPNAVANASTSTITNLNLRLLHPGGAAIAPNNKPNPFDVPFYCFFVSASVAPTGVAFIEPGEVANCGVGDGGSLVGEDGRFCVRVAVTPGENPPSTGLHVILDLSQLGQPDFVEMPDDGSGCDEIAGDLVFSSRAAVPEGLPPGPRVIRYLVFDDQGRSTMGESLIDVRACRPLNDLCERPIQLRANHLTRGTTLSAQRPQGLQNCMGGLVSSPTSWYTVTGTGTFLIASLCESQSTFDAKLSIYCGSSGCDALTCIAGGDNECGTFPQAGWCSQPGATYFIAVHGAGLTTGEFSILLLDSGQPCIPPTPCLPSGACCTEDGCFTTTATNCDQSGGTYLGDDTSCVIQTNPQPVGFVQGPLPRPIADNDPQGTDITIFVPEPAGVIEYLGVAISLQHDRASDLYVTLSRAGTTVLLFAEEGGDAGLFGTYILRDDAERFLGDQPIPNPIPPDIYRPRSPLSAFAGQPLSGQWTLRIRDRSPGALGVVTGAQLLALSPASACNDCSPCPADFNQDGGIDGADVAAFFTQWEAGAPCGDVNLDGGIDGEDVSAFFASWENGAC
jgi:hypothetical protein